MHNMKIIGLYSPIMGSGKSTVASHLANRLNLKVISFAEPLKKMGKVFLESWGLSEEEINQAIYGNAEQKAAIIPDLGVSSRRVLQTLGTEWGRNCIKDDLWPSIALRNARSAVNAGFKGIVIDDLRFPNEKDAIEEVGGICIKITRPSVMVAQEGHTHASEGALDGEEFHSEIVNNGTIQQLEYMSRLVAIPYILGYPNSLQEEIDSILAYQGSLAGKKIRLVDPDNRTEATLFEDIDVDVQDYGDNVRRMLVTFEPGYTNAMYRNGDGSAHQVIIDHKKASADIKLMVKNGWIIDSILRDL
jgi:hypothetical protein